MNTTLTAIAVALIAAIATALVAPLFIDWTAYRAEFEQRTSRIVGAPVRVLGDVDARILPSPSIRFHEVVIGSADDGTRFEASDFAMRLSFTPLLRGEVHVRELVIDGARLTLTADDEGALRLPFNTARADAVAPSRVMFDRISLTDGAVVVEDALSGRRFEATGITGLGSAGSLAGPFRFDGDIVVGGRKVTLQAAAGRFGAERRAQIRADAVMAGEEQGRLQLDGALDVLGAAPRFEGRAEFSGVDGVQPWRLTAQMLASPRRLDVERFEAQLGPDERALRIEGLGQADFRETARGRFEVRARQLDFDRLHAEEGALAPLALVRAALDRLQPFARHPAALAIDMRIDGIQSGGELVQDVALAVTGTDVGWRVETLRARLPAGGELDVAGTVTADDERGLRFTGRGRAGTPNLPLLVRWGTGSETPDLARQVSFSGEIDLSAQHLAVSQASLAMDGETAEGAVQWSREDGMDRFRTDLKAERLDLDALTLSPLLATVADADGERARSIEIGLAARELVYGGLTGRDVNTDLSFSSNGMELRRLQIGDLGGAAFDAAGDLVIVDGQARGGLEGSLKASSLRDTAELLRRFGLSPRLITALEPRLAALGALDLVWTAGADGGVEGGLVIRANGAAGPSAFDMKLSASAARADAAIDARLEFAAADGGRLLQQFGIPAAPSGEAGRLVLTANGHPSDALRLEVDAAVLAARFVARGEARLLQEQPEGTFDLSFGAPDAIRVRALYAGEDAPAGRLLLPVRLVAKADVSTNGLLLRNIEANLDDRTLSGDIRLSGTEWREAGGSVRVSAMRLSEIAALGLTAGALEGGDIWPTAAASPGLLAGLTGQVDLAVGLLQLADGHDVRNVEGRLGLTGQGVALVNMSGAFAGGRLSGDLQLETAQGRVMLRTRALLTDAELSSSPWPVSEGRADVTLDAEGSGGSIAEAVAALTGGGTLNVRNALVQGVNPDAFQRVAAEMSDSDIVPEAVARAFSSHLATGSLRVRDASAAFSVAGGVARAPNLAVDAEGLNVNASISLNIKEMSLELESMLSPRSLPDTAADSLPRVALRASGPLSAPAMTTDVTALATFLTVRALENEMQRLEKIEEEARERDRVRRQLEEAEAARKAAEQRAQEERKRAQAEAERLAAEARAREAERQRENQARQQGAAAMPEIIRPAIRLTPPSGEGATPGSAAPLIITPENARNARPEQPQRPEPSLEGTGSILELFR